jgi:hypothetical protein
MACDNAVLILYILCRAQTTIFRKLYIKQDLIMEANPGSEAQCNLNMPKKMECV